MALNRYQVNQLNHKCPSSYTMSLCCSLPPTTVKNILNEAQKSPLPKLQLPKLNLSFLLLDFFLFFFSALRCSQRKTCKECFDLPGCGWCNDPNDTGLGKCMEGSDFGPRNITQSQCPASRWFFTECPGKILCLLSNWI